MRFGVCTLSCAVSLQDSESCPVEGGNGRAGGAGSMKPGRSGSSTLAGHRGAALHRGAAPAAPGGPLQVRASHPDALPALAPVPMVGRTSKGPGPSTPRPRRWPPFPAPPAPPAQSRLRQALKPHRPRGLRQSPERSDGFVHRQIDGHPVPGATQTKVALPVATVWGCDLRPGPVFLAPDPGCRKGPVALPASSHVVCAARSTHIRQHDRCHCRGWSGVPALPG